MTTVSARAAGWYDDETDAALLRYWDGAKWSPHTAARPTDAADDAIDSADAIDAGDAIDAIDASTRVYDEVIDEATTARSPMVPDDTAALFRVAAVPPSPPATPRPPEEHTTVPLPPEPGPPASAVLLEVPTKRRKLAWIVTGALVALGLVSTVLWSLITFAVR